MARTSNGQWYHTHILVKSFEFKSFVLLPVWNTHGSVCLFHGLGVLCQQTIAKGQYLMTNILKMVFKIGIYVVNTVLHFVSISYSFFFVYEFVID